MTIKEFEKQGYYIETMATAFVYGRYDVKTDRIINEEFEADYGSYIEYRIYDKYHDIIAVEFWNIDDVLEYIENM